MPPQAPHYSLKDIHAAVRKGNVVLRRGAERDATDLEYFDSEIKDCLLSLTEDNFRKTETYTHRARQTKCDDYLIKYAGPDGGVDDLYVKFSFNGWVVVHSFHLQR